MYALPDPLEPLIARIPKKIARYMELDREELTATLNALTERDTIRALTYDSDTKKFHLIIEHKPWVPDPLPLII